MKRADARLRQIEKDAAEPPRLGGRIDSFKTKYGVPVRDLSPAYTAYDFVKCPGKTAVARYEVIVENGFVMAITGNKCPFLDTPGEHDPAQALSEAKMFMPSDTVMVKTFASEGVGFDDSAGYQYRSASLGQKLPKRSSTACDGKGPVGTFVYIISKKRTYWMLAAGACP